MVWEIILRLIYIYAIISMIAFILLHYDLDWLEIFEFKHREIYPLVQMGTFIYGVFVLSKGIEWTLFFIPDSWVTFDRETLKPTTIKSSISFFLGCLATVYLACIFNKLEKLYSENRKNKGLVNKYLPKDDG